MDDHLTALNARLAPLKSVGTALLDAAIRAYHVLYPEATGPATIPELSKCLQATEDRLRAWRSSSARAGADRALSFVLGLYEEIDIATVRALRTESRWLTDPELIKTREEAADFFADYAATKYITPGRVYDDPEDDDIIEDAGSKGGDEEDGDAESSSEAQYAASDDEDAAKQTETEAPEIHTEAAAKTGTAETANAETAADISVEPTTETMIQPSAPAADNDAAD